MAAMSDYLEQQILNHIFRNTAIFTPPANVFLALFTAAPSRSSIDKALSVCQHPPEGPPVGLVASILYAGLAAGFFMALGAALLRWASGCPR